MEPEALLELRAAGLPGDGAGAGVRGAGHAAGRVDGAWRTVASVRGNTAGPVSSSFEPVTADALRILALASNDSSYSRIVELEAYAD